MNTTESMKDFELKYISMATQFFILSLLFPYFYELGLIFFSNEELLYLLIPGTLTWPAQQRLWWMGQLMVLLRSPARS